MIFICMTQVERKEIEKIVQKEVREFLSSTDAHKKVIAIIKNELKGKDIDDKMVEVATKVISELFKTLWTRKSFWEGSLKSVKP
jgi:translation elongation factor EF-Tu-like GTPase